MLPKLSCLHYVALTVAGSWLSWQRAFRWAVNYYGIKAVWLLFRCRSGLELALTMTAFLVYWRSSSFRHCEALLMVAWLYNFALQFANQPSFLLNNAGFVIAWHFFASMSLPVTFLKPIGNNYAVSERMISLLIAAYFLYTDKTCWSKALAAVVVAVIAHFLSRNLRSSEARFRCIKKVEVDEGALKGYIYLLQKFVDPTLLARK